MRPVDVVLLMVTALLAVSTLAPAFWNDWEEYTVACITAGTLSRLATLPKRYRTTTEKPWRLVSKR